MNEKIHWEILDEKRTAILPLLAKLENEKFYLAGGTGLALIIGHRDSLDFDFFKKEDFDTEKLFERIKEIFGEQRIVKTQEEKNTLSVEIDNGIKLSFFSFPYELIGSPIKTEYFPIAAVEDIACMKLSAITSRSVLKDYVDIYFILKYRSLEEILGTLKIKMSSLDVLLALKSLVYFDDISMQPIIFKREKVSLEKVREVLEEKVKTWERKSQIKS